MGELRLPFDMRRGVVRRPQLRYAAIRNRGDPFGRDQTTAAEHSVQVAQERVRDDRFRRQSRCNARGIRGQNLPTDLPENLLFASRRITDLSVFARPKLLTFNLKRAQRSLSVVDLQAVRTHVGQPISAAVEPLIAELNTRPV